jgi:hypothetical protein
MSIQTRRDYLIPEAVTELDRTCARVIQNAEAPPPRHELRPLARAIANGARAVEMLPERMVMEVRARWRVAFRTSDCAERERGETVLGELLTLCIEEYFADVPPLRSVQRHTAAEAFPSPA